MPCAKNLICRISSKKRERTLPSIYQHLKLFLFIPRTKAVLLKSEVHHSRPNLQALPHIWSHCSKEERHKCPRCSSASRSGNQPLVCQGWRTCPIAGQPGGAALMPRLMLLWLFGALNQRNTVLCLVRVCAFFNLRRIFRTISRYFDLLMICLFLSLKSECSLLHFLSQSLV